MESKVTSTVMATWISSAPIASVFSLVKDMTTWPSWSDVESLDIETEGSGDRHGIGAVRRIVASGYEIREKITEVVENERISYTLLSGLPVSNYHGLTEFEREPDGRTLIRWTSTFDTGSREQAQRVSPVIRNIVRTMVRQAALSAEIPDLRARRARSPSRPPALAF